MGAQFDSRPSCKFPFLRYRTHILMLPQLTALVCTAFSKGWPRTVDLELKHLHVCKKHSEGTCGQDGHASDSLGEHRRHDGRCSTIGQPGMHSTGGALKHSWHKHLLSTRPLASGRCTVSTSDPARRRCAPQDELPRR